MASTLNPVVPLSPADIPDMPIVKLMVQQYHDLLRTNAEVDREPVELLEGWVVPKTADDATHATAADLTADMLRDIIPPGWVVRGSHPVTTEDSEPEPDAAVVRGSHREYARRHPTPAGSALVVEVANSSLRCDRGIKRRIYARAGVPVYWVVVLAERCVEVYADPSGPAAEPAYAVARRYADGERVPVVIDGREVGTIAVADLLP